MTGALTVFLLLYASLLAGWALVRAVRRARPDAAYLGGLALLELMLLLRAGLELPGLLAGRAYAEPAVHAAYLIASVALLPLVLGVSLGTARPGGRDAAVLGGSGWDSAVAAVACVAVAVVTVRLAVTGRPA